MFAYSRGRCVVRTDLQVEFGDVKQSFAAGLEALVLSSHPVVLQSLRYHLLQHLRTTKTRLYLDKTGSAPAVVRQVAGTNQLRAGDVFPHGAGHHKHGRRLEEEELLTVLFQVYVAMHPLLWKQSAAVQYVPACGTSHVVIVKGREGC